MPNNRVFYNPTIVTSVLVITAIYGLLLFGLNYFINFEVSVIVGLVIILGHLSEIVLYLTRKDQDEFNRITKKKK